MSPKCLTILIGLVCLAHSVYLARCAQAEKIHVLIWDERQPRQAEAYENFLGNEIAQQLGHVDDLEIRSVCLEDPEQGLNAGNLEWADVIVWWGHVRHSDLAEGRAKLVLEYIQQGELDLIVLHSAHWARPFVEAMNWRSIEDAKRKLAVTAGDSKFTLETVAPPMERTVPIHGGQITPAVFGYKENAKEFRAVVHLPYCCFPDYRPDGKPSVIRVLQPEHPIAAGLAETIVVKQTEMYNEPFHVPEPDELIFEETWEAGERFRSGMIWNIGRGKVFYFRPGHETYPVYKQPEMIQVLENACRWLASAKPTP
jgi:trehalose utilization protein